MDVHNLPAVNASLNALAGILLFSGYRAIKKGDRELHTKLMIAAMVTSALFLCSYITYHLNVPGPTHYKKEGLIRFVYFFILLTHTPLAVIILPASLTALWYALRQDFVRHVKITRWLFPVWSYVSVTGVLIYLMLYVF